MSDGNVRGIVHLIEQTKTYGQKGFRKRLVVLEQDQGAFTNYVPVEFTRDDCDKVDDLHEGDDVEIAFRLSGRKWQRDSNSEVKYFLNAEAISFKVISGGAAGSGTSTESAASANDQFAQAADDEEIPF